MPWHVNKNCNILVDLNSLKSRQDITIDCGSWILSKTYTSSSKNKDGPSEKEILKKNFRLVKRLYKCKEPADLRKNIMTLCCPHKKATGRYPGQFNDCDQFALITYRFLNGERETELSPKSRTYPNVRNELKQSILVGKTPNRAVHEVIEKRGRIFNTSSASEIPEANQAYRISKITRKASDDPLKQLIEKQHRDGRT